MQRTIKATVMIIGVSLHLGMTTQTAVYIFDPGLYFMVHWLWKFESILAELFKILLPCRRGIAFSGILVGILSLLQDCLLLVHCPFYFVKVMLWDINRCSPWTLVLLDMCALICYHYVFINPCPAEPKYTHLCKQCRSRSVGFWRIQLIWICTVCH